jgi:hypothetical protein
MTKLRTTELAIINLTMHPHSAVKYAELLYALSHLRNPAKVWGEYKAEIGTIGAIEPDKPENGVTGEIFRYFELDPRTRWFNVVRKKTADERERALIQIPENLKPHFSFFYYVFFPKRHMLVFETQFGQARLTPGAAVKMLEGLCKRPAIVRDFGTVNVTALPRADSLNTIFRMPMLRRLEIELTKPNADGLGSAKNTMMRRLDALSARSQTIVYNAEAGKSLQPDAEVRLIAKVAQSNGHVEAQGLDGDGRSIHESTQDHPRIERAIYNPKLQTRRDAVIGKAEEIAANVTEDDAQGDRDDAT